MSAPGSPRQRARRPILLGLLIAAVLCFAIPGVASAHAHLVQADPAPGAVIAHGPAVASFVFDEGLNPTLTRVRVVDAAGHAVTTNPGHLAPGHGGMLWRLPLPSLKPGTYSVFWTSESATDGHVMSSFYTFRVAATGTAARMGAAIDTGAMAGMTAGSGHASGWGLPIDGGMAAITLFIWLGLMAQALWLGALVIELAVLAPARRAAVTPEARLAWLAATRVWQLVRVAPFVIAASLAAQVLCLALEGTGGDWGRALAPATLGGILSSQNGNLMALRAVLLLVAIRLTGRTSVPASAPTPTHPWPRPRRAPQTLGIMAPPIGLPRLDWESARVPVTILAAIYMLAAAFSGHAANVAPALLWQSCTIDWLHLVCTAAWAGGMAVLAFGVMPARHALPAEQRVPALLPLLDRFSPVAYVAVGMLALSGLYSAAHHLDAPSMLSSTVYGQILLVKTGLVGLLMALSASHVLWLRPRIARAQYRAALADHAGDARAMEVARVHEGLASLASRLRVEAWVGACILLATALMSQTLPTDAASHGVTAPAPAIPASISGAATTGDLRGQLTVAPPRLGSATFTVRLWEKGRPVTEDDGAAIIHLFPITQPAMRAVLTPRAHGTLFSAQGSVAMAGAWHADVLVRTATVDDYRTLSFTFTVGSGAHFVSPHAHLVSPHKAMTKHTAHAMSGM